METVSVLLSVLCVSGAALAQCSRNPSLFITAPKTMEALTGSCLMIPCSFRTKPEDQTISTGTIYSVWIKNDSRFNLNPNNVIYNSSKTVNIYPVTITGNLRQRNCTTLFSDLNTTHTDTFYFRMENGALRATASCDPVQINVRDAPGSPRLNISGDLREDVSVTITCSASTPCPHFPPKLTWNLQAEPDTHTEENTDGTFTTKIQETITLSDQHDGLTISCSASYPVTEGIKTAETLVTLSVSYAPKDTSASISPSAVVSAGSWVNLSCSSRARPPVSSFTWFQISSDGATANVSEGAFYTFNATGGGVYYCVASNGLGAQTSAQLHLTVGEPFSWEAVAGGAAAVILIICGIVALWWMKSKHPSPQTQCPAGENSSPPEAARGEELIHYGEISFSRTRADPSSGPVEGAGQQQDTVYAQVNPSHKGQAPEDLYSPVKKK